MAFAVPVCSALYSKLEIRPGPTHKTLESFSFFSKWPLLPGVQGSGKDLGLEWVSFREFLGLWVPSIFRRGSQF